MELKVLGSNMTEVTLSNGTVVLFSYSTPVAMYNLNPHEEGGFFGVVTEQFFSVTTSRHINKWGAKEFKKVPQEYIEHYVSVASTPSHLLNFE